MSNINTQSWRLPRRHFLRGLGATIALPFLDCMRPAMAAAAGTERARRSIFIYLPNGVNTLKWQITQPGADYELSEPMKSLERHRSIITPISGMHHPGGLGHHHNCRSVWLTGAKIGPSERNSISVDQLISQKTSEKTRFSSVEMSVTNTSLAVNADGISLPAQDKPSEIFNRMFSAPDGGNEAERRRLHKRGSVLDVVLGEAGGLRKKIGTEDRTRLDQYLTSVREVEIRTERADAWLDVARPDVDDQTRDRVSKQVSRSRTGEYYKTVYDLMALTLQTDMSRVITFLSGEEGGGLAIPEININQTRHELSHHNGDPEQIRRLTRSDEFNVEQFAYLLDRLSEVRDGDGALIDTTQILYGSGMAYGHSHGNANLPLVLAGGSELGLKHGQHLDFNQGHFDGYNLDDAGAHYGLCGRPANKDAHLSNLLLTMAGRMGVEAESFRDSNGIVKEVLA